MPTKTMPAVLSCQGMNTATSYIKINFLRFSFMQITPYCTVRSQNEPKAAGVCAVLWKLRSICLRRPTFHNGSNLYRPVVGLSAAGPSTQGIRAECTPLSDTNSHSARLCFMHFAVKAFLFLLPFCEEPIETLPLKNDSNTALHMAV